MSIFEIAEKARSKLKFPFPYDTKQWVEDMGMMMENYHKHTTWSDLVQIDSATDMIEFMRLSTQYGCQCLFSGEHGYQGEWLYVYDLCKNSLDEKFREKNKLLSPLKFRYSTEAYWVKDTDKLITVETVGKDGTKGTRESRDNANCHMIIVARNYNASRKLNFMLSEAHGRGFYHKPRIDLKMLFELDADDVYITSACVAGWKYEDAEEIWLKIWERFGNSFFLEYQPHNTKKQRELNARIYQMSQKYGIQTIIGLDTHYINAEDEIKRQNLLQRKKLEYPDEDDWVMDFPDGKTVYQRMIEQGVLPPDEIIAAMMNTHVFLNGCEEIQISTEFKIPILPKYQGLTYEERTKKLEEILETKFQEEEPECRTEDRHEGMMYELGEFEGSTTVDYPLTNYEIVKLATSEKYGGQLTTTSRGSASSYYSSKLLGFTTMDRFESEVPIYPERFITKDRILSSHQCPD